MLLRQWQRTSIALAVGQSWLTYHLTGDAQCLPLYRYDRRKAERVSNITQWGIRLVNDHYRKEWGKDFEKVAGKDGITVEQIFAYTYAVLHDPVYRHDYAVDLLREFPRLPLYHDFDVWARMGQGLLDLHIGFESAKPFPLAREETGKEPGKPKLRADKERGVIILDDATRLTGVPPDAWRYRLGSRSALEWVLDQYKERKPKDPTIAARFDTYRFADYKRARHRPAAPRLRRQRRDDGHRGRDGVLGGRRPDCVWRPRQARTGDAGAVAVGSREPEDPEWEACVVGDVVLGAGAVH